MWALSGRSSGDAAISRFKSNGDSGSHAPDSHAFRSQGTPPGFKCQTRSTRAAKRKE